MSWFVPSASPRPLVTSGTAVTPPVPVLVVAPVPWRMNHVSIVNVGRPSAAVFPKVTYALVPPNCSALFCPRAVAAMQPSANAHATLQGTLAAAVVIGGTCRLLLRSRLEPACVVGQRRGGAVAGAPADSGLSVDQLHGQRAHPRTH